MPTSRTPIVSAILTLAVTALATPAIPAQQPAAAPSSGTLQYPVARRSDHIDVYFGDTVADPYRWLEDVDSPETHAWVQSENRLSRAYFDAIPARAGIAQRLDSVWDYAKYGAPFRAGARTFWTENSGLQNQSVLWVQDGRRAQPRVLLDPNALSADGTVALGAIAVSDDGRYLAYGTSASGSDWQEFHVRDVATARDLADTLEWIKFSGMAWTKDDAGFFYDRYQKPDSATAMTGRNLGQKLYYHRLGTPQAQDQLVFEIPEHPDWFLSPTVSDDGRYLVISIAQGTDERNRLYFADLGDPAKPNVSAPIVKLFDDNDATYAFVGNIGQTFLVRTDRNAPRGRVIQVNTNTPRDTAWKTVVAEGPDALQNVTMVGKNLVADYLHDAYSVVRLYTLYGTDAGTVPLPGIGSVAGITGRPRDTDFYFTFTSFLYPTSVFRYDLRTRQSVLVRAPRVSFDPSRYETKQVFYTSRDGTRIPMFLTMKKGLPMDGSNPALLYAYGGFNISVTPSFSPRNLVWLEMGGIYAVPNIRGGGEYGKAWHEAGMFEKKQNVFDDFIAAAEYLIAQGYTSTPKLAISGASNGGLLIGAVETQRPDLFGAALPAVGVMDMLRFQKFTVGWAWASEYGSSDDSTQFAYLIRYSPLQNIRPGTCYPPTLVTTADHDDRVVPGHSFKFAATMQADQACANPVLISIESKAGHGGGKPTSKQIAEAADAFAFLVKSLGMQPGALQ